MAAHVGVTASLQRTPGAAGVTVQVAKVPSVLGEPHAVAGAAQDVLQHEGAQAGNLLPPPGMGTRPGRRINCP